MTLLSNNRVDLDSRDHSGSTSLSIAARNGHIKVVKLLRDTGRVDFNSRNCFARTPLWYARRYENIEIAQILLESAEKSGISLCENDLPVGHRLKIQR